MTNSHPYPGLISSASGSATVAASASPSSTAAAAAGQHLSSTQASGAASGYKTAAAAVVAAATSAPSAAVNNKFALPLSNATPNNSSPSSGAVITANHVDAAAVAALPSPGVIPPTSQPNFAAAVQLNGEKFGHG